MQITATIVPRPMAVQIVRVGLAKLAANASVHLIGSLILPLTVIATTRALRNVRVTYIVVGGQTVMK